MNADEPLVELETDKVNVEVPSPLAGTLSSISVKEGDSVEVGALLGIVADGKSKTKVDKKTKVDNEEEKPRDQQKIKRSKKISKNKASNKPEVLTLVDEEKDNNSNGALVLDTLAADNVEEVENKKEYIPPKSRKNLSPSVRKIVEEENIDISNVTGSGPKGNIVKADMLKLMGNIPGMSLKNF